MATIRLSRYEVRERLLPPVCMKCGMDAAVRRTKTFAWQPPWVYVLLLAGLLPFVIVAVVLTKRMTMHAPLCEVHQNHWRWRAWFTWLGLAALAALGILSIVLLAEAEGRRDPAHALTGLLCGGGALAGLGWLIAAAVLQASSIRPTEITDDSITLTKVSRAFVDALWEERHRRGKEDPQDEPRWRRGDDNAYREGRPQ